MALTAASMKTKIRAAQAAVPAPANNPSAAAAYSDAMLEALCQGIIDEFTANGVAHVIGVTAGGDTVDGSIL